MRVRVLLLGATGQVGWEVARVLAGGYVVISPRHGTLDLTRSADVWSAIRAAQPDIIINAAGYTDVDRAEKEPDDAEAVNALAPAVLAQEAASTGALLIHYSTDYVFDGSARQPYVESDTPAPLNVYGRTKLEGERAVQAAGGRHVILRTSWVYGPRGRNFLLTMRRLFLEREEVRVVDDQVGTPTSSRFIAEATQRVIQAQGRGASLGLFHLAASGQTSWHGFASRILELDRRPEIKCRRVIPIRSDEYPTDAKRPAYSVLSCTRFEQAFGLTCGSLESQLEAVMREVS